MTIQSNLMTSALLCLACSVGTVQAGQSVTELRGDIMFASMLCNGTDKASSARLVRDHASLENFYQRLQSSTLGARHPVPKMNYEKEMLLIVEMGQMNTGGYQLSFDSRKPIIIDGSHATVTVTWQEPEAGSITAQMLTTPCVIIRLPAAPVETLTILDQHGKMRYQSDSK